MTTVTVLGRGRMGSAIAARLSPHVDLRTWTRRDGGSPATVVCGAEMVLLCLYDGPACRQVLGDALSALPEGATVVNTATVSPAEASELEALTTGAGVSYLHAPVVGSTPAVQAGRLTILAGAEPSEEAAGVMAVLGDVLVVGGTERAAALKLLANGVLGDAVASLRRSLARGDDLGAPREAVLDVLSRTVLAPLLAGKRAALGCEASRPPTTFAAGALAKDLVLLGEATGATSEAGTTVRRLLDSGALSAGDDVSMVAVARPDLSWLNDARLDVSPEVVVDEEVLRPLYAYALTHATGDPSHLPDAFLPGARIEGFRDGELTSWALDSYATLFDGPAEEEDSRTRRLESLEVHGGVGTAVMTLRHGDVLFTDVFVLLRRPDGAWRIASKAYQRHLLET